MPEQIVDDKQVVQDIKKEDLTTRVSQVKLDDKKDEAFNVNDIEKIQDPNAKAYAEKAYKSFEKGYQVKYQDLAAERKAWEAKKAESDNWTQEKVQSLLNDPKFIQSAQGVVGQQSTDDYSALSDTEKKQIQDAKTIASQALQQNAQLLRQQQDEGNKTKYANYDSNAVDIITADMIKGRVHATREHLWKVVDYDDAVKRAYELGLSDKKVVDTEKINSMSTTGQTVVGDESVPKIEDGETNKNYFLRLAARRFQQSKESGQIRK